MRRLAELWAYLSGHTMMTSGHGITTQEEAWLKPGTVESFVEASFQNDFSVQLLQEHTTTRFDAADVAREIAKYVLIIRNFYNARFFFIPEPNNLPYASRQSTFY
jgi:hypothetical protein